jgi:hypothetical protein
VLKKKKKKKIDHESAPKKFIYLGPIPSNSGSVPTYHGDKLATKRSKSEESEANRCRPAKVPFLVDFERKSISM